MVWKYLDAARDTGTIIGGQAAWLEAKLEAVEARLGILAMFRSRLGLEEVVGWAAADFDGDEPIHPGLRADLDAAAERITQLTAQLEGYGAEIELPSASDTEMVGVLKRAIAN